MKPLTRRPLLFLIAMACVLLAAAFWAGACGSKGDTSESTNKTYTNSDYGFSFQYPANWELREGNSSDVTAGGSPVASVGVYDPDGAIADNSYIDLAQILIYKLTATVDASMMPQAKAAVESVLASLESQAGDMKTVEPLAETQVGSMMGYKVTYTFTQNDAPATSTVYFLFSEDIEYQVTVQAASENWEADQAVFSAIVASLTPGSAR